MHASKLLTLGGPWQVEGKDGMGVDNQTLKELCEVSGCFCADVCVCVCVLCF
jgi:hypothetical protein